MNISERIILTPDEKNVIDKWVKSRTIEARLSLRAKIIQLAAKGLFNHDIAKNLNISRPTVQLWKSRFLSHRLEGLKKDAPRPGRLPKISDATVKLAVETTLYKEPKNATHWSVRSLAKEIGISRMSVQRIFKQYNLKPHLIKTFKLSNDPNFLEKLYDIVGLYMNPPEKALVLCVDEKSQIQALERSQPLLKLKLGFPASQTHDYKRHGTTTLFAALNMLDGTIIGDCMPRHRHLEFIRFLKKIDRETPSELELHLIVDNYCTHKNSNVKRWLKRHPRFHFHFTPTSSSWLNMIERWFREITSKRIRRGSFKNVKELIQVIKSYIDSNNQTPKVFTWTASADSIIKKIAKCKEVFGTQH